MDHELKQRLIGAVVVTALCAIFIPMLFDDPVDNSGQVVSELNIPAPVAPSADTAGKLPSSADQILKSSDPEPLSTEPVGGEAVESTGAVEEVAVEPEQAKRSGESLYAESEGYDQEDAGATEAVQQPSKPKQSAQVVEQTAAAKAPIKEIHPEVKQPPVKPVTEKPLAVKKPPYEQPVAVKDATAVVKQPNTAKGLAAAIAEAKKPAVAPKPVHKVTRWYIQVGSFSKKENAVSLWDSLREQGLPASLDTVQTENGISYRLRVGPELDGKKAAAMKARLDRQNIRAILVSE